MTVAAGAVASTAPAGIPIVSNPRFGRLDGVRAVAALLVLLTHVSFVTRANIEHPLGPELARLNTGVSVFFVLSGFLLYRPFVAARLQGEEQPDAVPYLWRRLLRIYPAYWLALAAVVALGPATIPDAQSFLLWTSLANAFSPEHFLGPLLQSYTLGVEVCFYLLVPVWAWFVRRLPGPVVRTELRALAVLGAAGVVWQLVCLALDGDWELVYRSNLPGWLDHFAIGMALAVVHAAGHRVVGRLAALPAWAWWAAAALAVIAAGRGLGIERSAFYLEWWQELGVHVAGIVLAVGLVVPAVARDGRPNRLLAWIGVVSYGVYLWHEFLLDRWSAWRWTPPYESNPAPFEATLVVVLVGSIAVASVSWLAVERPILRLKTAVRSTAQVLDGRLAPRLAALTVLGLAVRVAFVLGWRRFDAVGGDPYWYHRGANLLADGEGFVNVFRFDAGVVEPGADHPPAYLVWLAISSVFGGTSLVAHQLWTCVLGALAVPFCGLAGDRLGGNRAALAAAAIAAASPLLWVYDALLLSETMAITAMAAATWLALRARARTQLGVADDGWPSSATPGLLGVALGVLVLTRAEAALLVPVVLLCALWGRWRHLAVAVVAVGVVVGPWVVANLVRFEHPSTLSTQLGTTLAHAYCDDTFHGEWLGWWSYPCAAELPVPPGDTSNADLAYREHALDYLGDNTGRLPVVVAARVGRTFGLYDPLGQAQLDRVEGRPEGVARAAVLLWYPTAVAAALGWVRLRRRGWTWRSLAPLWAPVACVLLTVVAFYGTTRFRALAEPAVAVLAAASLAARPHEERA